MRLRPKAASDCVTRFDWDNVTRQWEQLFCEMVGSA